ncbi:MarR family transcriptional regulator [Paracoccus sp. 11-3]|uniref:MarR family transcriptional regulator n=1 Tax=Paracoccus amoyensis TaxID=2760093 RepID=A0A926GBN1_9RHOB|nr:MarR family transcriptional regulator [Paracoccus amoyensis]MBC9246120.1 MarR family transcriptional regulator [Paracoccus amoyensis]
MNNVHDTHISDQFRNLHAAVLDIAAVMARPQRDEFMVKAAGITLDRALFPLLVLIGRSGPIGVVELADRVGRDYTTVSRQVARLESLGLIQRRAGGKDRRVREAVITDSGRKMIDRIDAARERIARAAFADWDVADIDDLVRLMRRYADTLMQEPKEE